MTGRARFPSVVQEMHARLGANAVPVQLPIGNEAEFVGWWTWSACGPAVGRGRASAPPTRGRGTRGPRGRGR